MDLQHDIEKILLSEAELDAIVEGLAVRISRDYADKKPVSYTHLTLPTT